MSTLQASRRRGSILTLSAIMLTMVFAMVMFTVDTGYLVHTRTELQRQADACALAAAAKLPGRTTARSVAVAVASENLGTAGAELNTADVEFGTWDRDARTFTATSDASGNTTAVRVTLKRTAANNNALTFFFAGASRDVVAQAVATYDKQLCGPLVGIEQVSGNGSPVTNSYDGNPLNGYTGEGNICSDGPITLSGNPTVNGDATAGKGYIPSLGGSAVVTGSIGSRVKPLNLPPINVPANIATETGFNKGNNNSAIPDETVGNSDTVKSTLDNQRNLKLVGGIELSIPAPDADSGVLEPGVGANGRYVYYLNDLEMHGGSTLTITEPTTIYLTGSLITSGCQIINTTENAGMLTIYMIGPTHPGNDPQPPTASLSASVDFYGVIYSPDYDVTVSGTAAIYGAIIGKTLTVSGTSGAFYDESLDLAEVDFPMRTALVE